MGSNKTTKVYVHLMFLRIGEIDTLNEKYQAHASIEARWLIDQDKLSQEISIDDRNRLQQGKSITLTKYSDNHWHPQLYIENTFGELKEQITYSAKRSKFDDQIYVCEHREIKGLFWEKLELHHFPLDVQDLSISIASMLYDDKVLLISDPQYLSGVNREAFIDQQEWKLYEHVAIKQRFVKEFIFRSKDEDDDDIRRNDDRKRSVLTVTCHAARRSTYFYWNGYFLIFLITLVSFCIFMIPPHLLANRIQISCTLLLTSITFRWTVNKSLPTISYLTSMDKYAIICIIHLVVHCIWHAIIGTLVFENIPDFRVKPDMWLMILDRYVFVAAVHIFILIHLMLFVWLLMVPLKRRRFMEEKEAEYREALHKEKTNSESSNLV